MLTVYISGPIAGRPEGNRAAFAEAEWKIVQAGHIACNPQMVDHSHPGRAECFGDEPLRAPGEVEVVEGGRVHRYGCYMTADLKALLECDAYVMLPGWQASRGAKVEEAVARICGLRRLELWDLPPATEAGRVGAEGGGRVPR